MLYYTIVHVRALCIMYHEINAKNAIVDKRIVYMFRPTGKLSEKKNINRREDREYGLPIFCVINVHVYIQDDHAHPRLFVTLLMTR